MKTDKQLISAVLAAIADKKSAGRQLAEALRDVLIFAVEKNNFRPVAEVMPQINAALPETYRKLMGKFHMVIRADKTAKSGVSWKKSAVTDEQARNETIKALKAVNCDIDEKAKKVAVKTNKTAAIKKLEALTAAVKAMRAVGDNKLADLLATYEDEARRMVEAEAAMGDVSEESSAAAAAAVESAAAIAAAVESAAAPAVSAPAPVAEKPVLTAKKRGTKPAAPVQAEIAA